MLDSRLSKIQMPVGKVMNNVPDSVLQRIFKDHREYLPVALSHNSQKRREQGGSVVSTSSHGSDAIEQQLSKAERPLQTSNSPAKKHKKH